MAPMIDMVFLLLIFFMVASQLVTMEKVKVEMPVAESAKVPEQEKGRQIISIRPGVEDGTSEILMNLKLVTTEEIRRVIEKEVAQNPDLSIYLRADRRLDFKHVREVMDACAQAGVVDIIFGTYESEG